jgi:hypothetical protein
VTTGDADRERAAVLDAVALVTRAAPLVFHAEEGDPERCDEIDESVWELVDSVLAAGNEREVLHPLALIAGRQIIRAAKRGPIPIDRQVDELTADDLTKLARLCEGERHYTRGLRVSEDPAALARG